jgi:hypothetical protein
VVVRIESGAQRGEVRVTVRDTGPGIPEEHLPISSSASTVPTAPGRARVAGVGSAWRWSSNSLRRTGVGSGRRAGPERGQPSGSRSPPPILAHPRLLAPETMKGGPQTAPHDNARRGGFGGSCSRRLIWRAAHNRTSK